MRKVCSWTIVEMPAMIVDTTGRPASRAMCIARGLVRPQADHESRRPENARPFAANTTDGLETARSAPPSAGPRNIATLSSVLDAAFAAVSSPGEVTRAGSSADFAGRNTVLATAERATSA